MADETSLQYEDPKIPREVRDAIRKFNEAVEYEKELCQDPFMIRDMGHFAKSKVLDSLLNFDDPLEIVRYLNQAVESFRTYRAQQTSSNPIRIFRRERKAG